METTQSTDPLTAQPTPPPKARPRRSTLIAAGCALALAGGAAGSAATLAVRGERTVTVEIAAPPATGIGTTNQAAASVAAADTPSVVTITVTTPGGSGLGSGIVLSSDGIVLTNNHVIADAANDTGSLTVTTFDGKRAAATIAAQDPAADIAVLRVAGLTLTPAPLGSADTLRPGDSVVAIGSPLGLSGSVSVGVVSALHRDITFNRSQQGLSQQPSESLQDAIQTDAAINPGNSGGPLIDAHGRVVGVCTAIATLGGGYIGQQSGSIGIGFAVPIDTAYRIAQPYLTH